MDKIHTRPKEKKDFSTFVVEQNAGAYSDAELDLYSAKSGCKVAVRDAAKPDK